MYITLNFNFLDAELRYRVHNINCKHFNRSDMTIFKTSYTVIRWTVMHNIGFLAFTKVNLYDLI